MATTAVLIPALATFDPARAPAATVPQDADGGEPIVVEEITPRAVEDDSTITVKGVLTNSTESELDGATVRFRYSGYPLDNRGALDDFSAGDGVQTSANGPTVTVEDPLEPGASADFELTTGAEDLGLSGGSGVYPLTIDALDEDGRNLGIQRTFLPYHGDGGEPVDIAWIWPLMAHPQRADDDTYLGHDLAEAVGPNGRLGRLMAAGAQTEDLQSGPQSPSPPASPEDAESPDTSGDGADPPDDAAGEQGEGSAEGSGDAAAGVPLTWAVDPGTLDGIERLTTDPYTVVEDPLAVPAESELTTDTQEPDDNARIWLEQAREVIGDEPLIATPYASPDIAALLENGRADDAEDAVSLGEDTVRGVLGRSADPTVAMPASGHMNSATRDFFSEQGADTFLLGDAAMPAQPWIDHTPTAQAALPVDGAESDATALVTDSRLSNVLAQESWGPGEAELAQQRFAAETAMIAAEQPGTDRTIIAAPPRDWNPSPDFADGVLQATDDLPWLRPVALADIDPPADSARTGLTYPEDAAKAELSSTYLEQVDEVRSEVRLFNSILSGDSNDNDPFRPAILRLESATWRENEALAARARSLLKQSVDTTIDKVRIMPGEPVTLASNSGQFGVVVANDLEDHAVRVRLSMFSENSERLKIGKYTDEMEIGPQEKTTVFVPLSARINGRTVLHMSLQNENGEPISDEKTTVPVNATGLGNQALLISAAGALVLIIALAPRAVRKWARKWARKRTAGEKPDGNGAADGSEETREANASGAEQTAADVSPPEHRETSSAAEYGSASEDEEGPDAHIGGGAPRTMPHNGRSPSGDHPGISGDTASDASADGGDETTDGRRS